jgi:hypothetical protein
MSLVGYRGLHYYPTKEYLGEMREYGLMYRVHIIYSLNNL